MSAWVEAWPVALVTLALLFVPGAVFVSAVGARGFARVALAAPVSFALAGVIAIGAEIARLPFTPAVFAVGVVIAAALCGLGARFVRRRAESGSARSEVAGLANTRGRRMVNVAVYALAIVLPAAMIGRRLLRAVAEPDSIAQLFDNIYHLNAIATIVDTHAGSSLTLGNLTEASRGVYPAAMHDLAALVVQVGGFDITIAANMMLIMTSAVVWPISAIFLGTRIFGFSPAAVLLTGVLSSALGAFPYLLMSWGLVAPFLVAMTVLPIFMALVIDLFPRDAPVEPRWLSCFFLLVVTAGVGLVHPSAVVAGLIFAAPFALRALVDGLASVVSGRGWHVGRGSLASMIAYLVVLVGATVVARPTLSAAIWGPVESRQASVGSAVLSAPLGLPPTWAVAILLVIGLIAGARAPRRWWPVVLMFAAASAIYVFGAGGPEGVVRDILTSVWYRDSTRLAALLAVASLPLVVLGALAVTTALVRVVGRVLPGSAHRLPSLTARTLIMSAVVAVVLVPATQGEQLRQVEDRIRFVFSSPSDARLVSPDERELFTMVPEFVPRDGVVVGDPFKGASLVYATEGRRALAPHVFGLRSLSEEYLLTRWDQAADDPRVCEYIRAENAYWALDFPGVDALGGEETLAGVDDVEGPAFRELARVGDAVLWETTACGPVPEPRGSDPLDD